MAVEPWCAEQAVNDPARMDRSGTRRAAAQTVKIGCWASDGLGCPKVRRPQGATITEPTFRCLNAPDLLPSLYAGMTYVEEFSSEPLPKTRSPTNSIYTSSVISWIPVVGNPADALIKMVIIVLALALFLIEPARRNSDLPPFARCCHTRLN